MFDLTVLSIALMHAAPVLVVGLASRNRVLLLVTALVAGAVGVLYGDPRHAALDAIAVFVAWALAMARPGRREPGRAASADASPARAQGRAGKSSWAWNLVGLALVGGILYYNWTVSPMPAPVQRAIQQARSLPPAGPVRPAATGADSGAPSGGPVREGKAPRLPRDDDMRHCLALRSAEAIRACAEGG